jgi:hypothetical protein
MSYLDDSEIRKIINLKGSPLIEQSLADRQLEVVKTGFNYLFQEENKCLYLADEVGLGKTYIALGITSLLRHFSKNPESYQDCIIVPKRNLQTKWEKEIRQFINNNYLITDNRVKSVIRKPIGNITIYDKLGSIANDHPGYHIFRNSQFSLALSDPGKSRMRENLENALKDKRALSILSKAEKKGYFYAERKSLLKKLYAYLLSLSNPEIELLIVDEGHNYKSGMGADNSGEVADRNNVVARFLGLKFKTDEDIQIFNQFPDLYEWIKPKVQKLIVLSATPKTYSMMEIKCQFDCFLPRHILSGYKKEQEVKEKLSQFLIRGKMKYGIGGQSYTRNLCREEHRRGNVIKAVDAPELNIQNNEQALILGLLQYKTIKNLNSKPNPSFEIGMLAGFETFRIDQNNLHTKFLEQVSSNSDQKEYEETRSRKVRVSQDYDVLKNIIDSYYQKFGVLPPHPKQDAIVDATFNMMRKGEKSLIFVRRVASATELERRLMDKWENHIYNDMKTHCINGLKSRELEILLLAYQTYIEDKGLAENIEDLSGRIIKKIFSTHSIDEFSFVNDFPLEQDKALKIIKIGFYYLYRHMSVLQEGRELKRTLLIHCNLEIVKTELSDFLFKLLKKYKSDWVKLISKEALVIDMKDKDDDEYKNESYFFHSYFQTPDVKPFRKSKIHQSDWFDLNYYLLNQHFNIATFDLEKLSKENIKKIARNEYDIREVQEIFLKNMKEENYSEHFINDDFFPNVLVKKNTLLTEIFTSLCDAEFRVFLSSFEKRKKAEIFDEIKYLSTIIKSCIKNGSGFLPLYIAANAKGSVNKNYISLVSNVDSVFSMVLSEIKRIILDYSLVRAVNFPEGDSHKSIENKLVYQSPVIGISGESSKNRSNVATQFRMPGFPLVMITTDIFREGEDLHIYCQNIYHYGIAWNSSDMEQRTGRIDRINSKSYRLLISEQSVIFNNKLHVFYPYIKKTLEVNQVYRLFENVNDFVKSFDIVDSLKDVEKAELDTVVTEMPDIILSPLKSQFEFNNFTGFTGNGKKLKTNSTIGTLKNELEIKLQEFSLKIEKLGVYYHSPIIEFDEFKIFGDLKLQNRKGRRGPFRILIKNSKDPGKFLIEISSYLFKISTRVQKEVESVVSKLIGYELINIDDFHAIAHTVAMENYDIEKLPNHLLQITELADDIEERITRIDFNVFG